MAARLDLTELDGLDSLHAPHEALADAQHLAAELWGADRTFFLVGGSTVGIHAMVLAACNPGETLLLPRDAHMSAVGGLILAGAKPVYLSPEPLGPGLWGPPSLADLEGALVQHAPKAALLVRPTYPGGVYDLAPYAESLHPRGAALLVDEAHGAHLGLHPGLPPSALTMGADAAVQSTHKMLSALTPGAMLHQRGARLNADRLRRALSLLQTTSPSYLLLASLDAARRQEATSSSARWESQLSWAADARARIASLPGIRVLAGDPMKIGIDVSGAGFDGYEAADRLAEAGVIVEHATHRHVVAFLGPGTQAADLDRLVDACAAIAQDLPTLRPDPAMPPIPPLELLPREAFFAETRAIPWAQAVGAVAGELVCPYPPGAPALVPGERITREVVEYLDGLRAIGAQIAGPADPTLQTLRIIS